MSQLNNKGDLLERLNYQFIHDKFSNYELIWEKFVSVNFKINDDKRKMKQMISEYNYTCLESLICMKTIKEKNYKNLFGQDKLIESELLAKYLIFINDFFVFEAHMGRIYETIERTWAILKMNEDKDLLEFYHHRHNVLHSHKLPLQFHKKLIGVPELRAQGEENGWSDRDKFTWDDFLADSKYVQAIDDYLNDTFDRLVSALNNSFSSIMSNLKEQIRVWDLIDNKIVNPNFDPFSGTTMTVNFN